MARSRLRYVAHIALFLVLAAAPSAHAAVSGHWLPLPSDTPPSARFSASSVYDTSRHRLWLFGGHDGVIANNQLWSRNFDGATVWKLESPLGTPPSPRLAASMIYDPVGDRLVVYGGSDGTSALGDAWSLDLASLTWTALAPAGPQPPPRNLHDAIFDPLRRHMIVFGGFSIAGPMNDTWQLDLSTSTPAWSPLAQAGILPAARSNPSLVYDPLGDRVVLFGGSTSSSGQPLQPLGDTWVLNLAGTPAWNLLSPSGPLPPPRTGQDACYDSARRRMIVAGGNDLSGPLSDTWALDLTSLSWTALAPGGQPLGARRNHTLVYDPVGDQAFAYGGRGTSGVLGSQAAMALGVAPAITVPTPRLSHKAVYDPVHRRMLVFGGLRDNLPASNETTVLDLSSPAPTWQPLAVFGRLPGGRADQMQVFDPVGNRLIVYGGKDEAGDYYGDTWQLSFVDSVKWKFIPISGPPSLARAAGAAVYDPVGRRMIEIGGILYEGTLVNDVNALGLAGAPAWTPLATAGPAPPGRFGMSAVYDPGRNRIVEFGGGGNKNGGSLLNDLWLLDLNGTPTWTQLTLPGGPSPRVGHLATYDTARDRMLVFGGFDNAFRNDAWELSFAGATPVWTQLVPDGGLPAPRDWTAGVYDPVFDRVLMVGGNAVLGGTVAVPAADAWALEFGDLPTPVLTSLVDASAGPGTAQLTWYTPAGAGVPATVERTADGASWQDRGHIVSDDAGRLVFTDAVAEGGRYGYRLIVGAAQERTDVTWLDVPAAAAGVALRVGLAGAWPNPSRGAPTLSFALPAGGGPAVLEVFDVRGRRVFTRDVAALGPGAHALDLHDAFPARAGVYLATLRTGATTSTRKFAILP